MQTAADLIEQLKRDSSLLPMLSPLQFEEVIAELLAGFGWNVSLRRGTKDGGHDLLGIKQDISGLESSFIFECKRWAPPNKVGVQALKELHFLKAHFRIGHAVLVTTSSFTTGAREYGRQYSEIQLVDSEGVAGWISQYVRPANSRAYLPGKRFHSCFISYSHKDEDFVNLLAGRLRESGVRVWYAPKDLLPGRKLSEEIFRAIESFDKILIVLSEASMRSEWVKSEIRRARRHEIKSKARLLFPVSIIPFEAIGDWEYFDADSGKDLAAELREYLIPNFCHWKDHDVFDREFGRLLEGLEAGQGGGGV